MHLNKLFLESEDSPIIIKVLEDAKWKLRHLGHMTVFGKIDKQVTSMEAMLKFLKQNNIREVAPSNFLMAVDIDRFGNNSDLLEPLREIYFPDVDVPALGKGIEFHTDDTFDDGHMLLGFEFIMSGTGLDKKIETDCVVSFADRNDEINLPPPVKQYMQDRYMNTIQQINAILARL